MPVPDSFTKVHEMLGGGAVPSSGLITTAAMAEAAMESRGWRCHSAVSPANVCHLWFARFDGEWHRSTDCYTYRMGSAESKAVAITDACAQALEMEETAKKAGAS